MFQGGLLKFATLLLTISTAMASSATAIAATEAVAAEAAFQSAQPVWPTGRETEMNLTVGYRTAFQSAEGESVVLKIACSTVYRAWLNGRFIARGPARGPHGYYRVDELDLTKGLVKGQNIVTVEVAGYNVNSYDVLDQPSFFQAEVVRGGKVVASTGDSDSNFVATVLQQRLQKVQRYSFQRPFIEVYRLEPGYDQWRRDMGVSVDVAATSVVSPKKLCLRRVPYPAFEIRHPLRAVAEGKMKQREETVQLWKDRSLTETGPELKGYPEDQLEVIPTIELQKLATIPTRELDQPYRRDSATPLAKGEYRILDLGANLTGMLGATVSCPKKTRLWFVFDEVLSDGDVDFKRLGCANIISYTMAPGEYEIEGIDPYTMRYVKLICMEGECEVKDVHLREYKHPSTDAATFAASDERLNRLYKAGVETYRQNAVDIFTDCPSRERAGWLCDSFFTARVAHDLTDSTSVETNFYENYLLPKRFKHLPDGMLPMCYPADHYNGQFIPNWSLWFVVQLEEYSNRGGDPEIVRALKAKVQRLFKYFERFENSDGLLEKLESWVFIEWSEANKFVQDVNYPSNMLYAGALDAAGRIYEMPALREKADRIRDVVRQQSFDGEFFVDNALRRDGKLQVTKNRSEVCQYFAFFFGVASPATHSKLWKILRDEFGPDRKTTKAHWDVHVANSFIGNVLRLELLSNAALSQQILDESTAYLLYMVDRTETLWENDGAYASCNHGFASHVVHSLYRDVLGLRQVDTVNRVIQLRFADAQLKWCEGTIPTVDGPVHLRWTKDDDQITYSLSKPANFRVEVQNLSGLKLVQKK